MIEHLPDLYDAGIDSFKVEGRMKTALYVATAARTYKMAMKAYEQPEGISGILTGTGNRFPTVLTGDLRPASLRKTI